MITMYLDGLRDLLESRKGVASHTNVTRMMFNLTCFDSVRTTSTRASSWGELNSFQLIAKKKNVLVIFR